MNSAMSAQPVTTGPATINRMGLIAMNAMIVCLYQVGESPRKLLQKALREESLMSISPCRCLSLIVGGMQFAAAPLIEHVCLIRRLCNAQRQTLALYTGFNVTGYTTM
jgi:hypothetical protein